WIDRPCGRWLARIRLSICLRLSSVMDSDPLELLPPEELRDRLRGLYRLLDATRSVASAVDLDKALEAIVRDACRALDCDRASLYQYDPERQELYTRVVTE